MHSPHLAHRSVIVELRGALERIQGSIQSRAAVGTGAVKARKPPSSLCSQTFYAAANSTGSISVASSASAFELFTRFDTGHRCR